MPLREGEFEPTGHAILADELFEYLRDQIATGQLSPGERLVEEKIAHATSVSRTPVREALRRLKATGLVDNRGRSFVVVALSSAEYREVWSVLLHLSTWAVRQAASQRTEADLVGLRMLVESGRRAVEADDIDTILEVNRQFHDSVNNAAGNRVLADLIASLTLRVERGTDFAQARRQLAAQDEHEAIFAAIEAGDPGAAEEAQRRHLEHQLMTASQQMVDNNRT